VSDKNGNSKERKKKVVFIVYKVHMNNSWCAENNYVLILGKDILLCHQLYNF